MSENRYIRGCATEECDEYDSNHTTHDRDGH
jgi:hypothetical protein